MEITYRRLSEVLDVAVEQLKRFCLSLEEVIGGLEGLDEDGVTNLPEAP